VYGGEGGGKEENLRCMDVWGFNPELFGRVDWNLSQSRVKVSLWVNVFVIGTKRLRFVSRIFSYTAIFALKPRKIMENVSRNGFKC